MSDTAPGVIHADKAYALSAFQRESGLGTWAIRTARKNGLKVRYTGGRAFVIGQDFLTYLAGL